jgi:hypothetical protein
MTHNGADLPLEIEQEAGALISNLQAAGWTVSDAFYDRQAFGNWYVNLHRAGVPIQLVKDRSQYMVHGPSKEEQEAAGLWIAFNSFEEFRQAVVKWAAKPLGANL